MSLIIRLATSADARLIADISHQTFYETFAADNTPEDMDKFLNEQFTKGKLMLEVGSPGNIFLLAYYGDKVAGYAKLREGKKPVEITSNASIEIARIYASKEMIGKGIGKALMEKCIDIATEKNKEVIWLGVWEKNVRAIEFYLSRGFQKFGQCDFLLGDDIQTDWLMKKELT